MKKTLLTLLLLVFVTGFSQKQKSKSIEVILPSYPKKLPVKEMKTYTVMFLDKAELALPFSEDEMKQKINLESFSKINNNQPADLTFFAKGVDVDDLYCNIKRSGVRKEYYVDVNLLSSTKISIMLSVKGEPTQILELPINPLRDLQGNIVPKTITFSFDEADKYLDFKDVDQAKVTPTFVKKYLIEHLGKNYLEKELIPKLKNNYDYGSVKQHETFYYVKDKKNKPLKEESKNKIKELGENVFGYINSLEDIRENKSKLDSYNTYWKELLEKYKSKKKVAWAMLMNLHLSALITEDVNLAEDYLSQIIDLNTKSWATSAVKSRFEKFKERYNLNHNDKGERLYASSYEMDSRLIMIKKQEAIDEKALANNINNEPGYITLNNGDKLDGKVTLLFAKPKQDEQLGTMIELDGQSEGKYVTIKYTNDKGNERTKTYKFKKVKEIVIGDKVFKPINPESDGLDTAVNIMSLSFNNTKFMKELYLSEKLGLYEDLTINQLYIKFKKDKKAKKLDPGLNDNFIPTMSELFKSCPTIVEKIKKGELKNNEKDLLVIVKTFSEGCK